MIDVCMVSYNAPVELKTFLESYEKIKRRESNLFVRVNDPSEADYSYLDDHALTINTAALGSNIGYAKSANQLAAMGSNEIIGIFNMDVRLTEDLWDCVQYMQENEDVGVLGPRLHAHPKTPKFTCGGGVVGSQRHPEFRGWKKIDRGQFDDVVDVVGVSGAAYFIRRSVWEELTNCQEYVTFLAHIGEEGEGAFLPTEHWFEETFCTYHARAHGYRVVYYGPALMYHKQGASGKVKNKVWSRSLTLFQDACASIHGGIECEG